MIELSLYSFEKLREDKEFIVSRGTRSGDAASILLMEAAPSLPSKQSLDRIHHAYAIANELDSAWAVQPLGVLDIGGCPALLLDDPGGAFLDAVLCGLPSLLERLRFAVAIARALAGFHARRLIHRDLKPGNILLNLETGEARLAGFGLTTRLPRSRQAVDAPDVIAGTLAYMAPEQTGRMNRSVDLRSDLYSLGVTFYEMFVGSLPFSSNDPMELVHSHVARVPTAPHLRQCDIPEQLSLIILKLLAKTPEDRYQTATGVENDLQRCLGSMESQGHVETFSLGQYDVPNRLSIAERLYGREREVQSLLSAFNEVVHQGRKEVVLVSGYSGVGKSSVVNELHKALIPTRGLFASGKFDQYRRDIPYATISEACTGLVRQILRGSDSTIAEWRQSLLEHVGTDGQLLISLIPELELVIGKQPPVPELPPSDSKNRYHRVLQRLLQVFARPEHPLVLFLDDLQWLDSATVRFLEHLITHDEVRHLLLIGAYRDNEVGASHPLARMLAKVHQSGARVMEMTVAPLELPDVVQLVGDALQCGPERARPLASAVQEKTGGNPFFTLQFLLELEEDALLALEPHTQAWVWDAERIRAKGYSDNVVDLMVRKLNRLPEATKEALVQIACLGSSVPIVTLRLVSHHSDEGIHEALSQAVEAGLIVRTENAYRFSHDRVQEAAYSLIPPEERAQRHLRIGTLLADNTPPAALEESVFDIANQLNRASHLNVSAEGRTRAARLNLIAGRRAKNATGYLSALRYLNAGRSHLSEAAWMDEYELIFGIEHLIADCELLTAELAAAETRLALLSRRAKNLHDFALVTRSRLTLYTTLDRSDLAIDVFLEYLRRGGTNWSKHPTLSDVMAEYNRVWSLLGSRRIDELVDLPLMSNLDVMDMMDVCTEIVHPALFYDENLSSLVICRMVNLSLEHGNGDASCFAYVWFAMIAGPRFNHYEDGFRVGQLGHDLVEKRGLMRHQARTYISFSTLLPWAKHALTARELVHRAFDVAHRTGDLTFSAYAWHVLITNYLTVGDALADVQGEAENGLAFATKAGFGLVADNAKAQLGLIRMLRGLTTRFGNFDYGDYTESEAEAHFAKNPSLVLSEFFYWTRKLQGRFLARDYAAAVESSRKAHRLLWTATSQVETGDFRFFAALAHAAAWTSAHADDRPEHLKILKEHYQQLAVWAEHCPANFENRAVLAAAEIARIEGSLLEAERLYEKAIDSAHANGFKHQEAIANEVASRFYEDRGLAKIAHLYLRDAQACYLRWGADAKARQLNEMYPEISQTRRATDRTNAILTSVDQLDIASVIKMSQAVSGEIELGKLIDTLMRTAIEHVGAERGVLILPRGAAYQIEAEATVEGDAVLVTLRQESVLTAELPEAVFNYVTRTNEMVLLHNASGEGPHATDDYIQRHQARSVLCLPLLKQTRLVGVLYLENNLATHVFTPARAAVLKLLASQAATSLENTRLYGELQEREARVSRLFNANIIGIFNWKLDGRILEANQAFAEIVGYSTEDFISGRVRWRDLMPPEWDENDDRILEQMLATGVAPAFEAEYIKKDGSRVAVLVGAALVEGKTTEGVAFVLDLSEHKKAEAKLRRSEAFLAEAQKLSLTGSFGWNVSADEHYWSDETFRIFEYDLSTPVTLQLIRQRVHPQDLPLIDAAIALAAQGMPLDCECRLVTSQGGLKHVHIVGHGVQDRAPGQEYVGAVQDVSERRLSEEALSKVRSELAHVARITTLGALTASIAHEVRQPLSGIMTNAATCLRMLAGDPPDVEGARETARRTIRDGQRAADVMTRLRDMFSKKEISFESVDLNEAAREVLALSLTDLQRNQAVVRAEFAEDLRPIMGDRVQLQQVILNLLLNASEAMVAVNDRPRHLVIRTERAENEHVRLSVSDVGPGVAPEQMGQLFEQFYTTKPDGMGIGLSVTRSIIERHQGRIWATTNDGHGMTFSFSIPCNSIVADARPPSV